MKEVINLNSLSINLRRLLDEKGMNQRSFAKKVGVSEQTISRYINGERLPDYDTIDWMANALQVSVNELFKKNDERVEIPDYKSVIDITDLNPEQRLLILSLINYFKKCK